MEQGVDVFITVLTVGAVLVAIGSVVMIGWGIWELLRKPKKQPPPDVNSDDWLTRL